MLIVFQLLEGKRYKLFAAITVVYVAACLYGVYFFAGRMPAREESDEIESATGEQQ